MSIVMKCLSANHRVAVGRHCATTTAICRSRSNGPESAAGHIRTINGTVQKVRYAQDS